MRVAIAKEVESINPADSLEEEHQEDVLMWINSGAELFRLKKPDTPPKHLVSYFVVIDGDYVLLVDHKNAQLWLPSGGHVDPEEHPRDTVIREAYEELKIKADFRKPEPYMITCTETVGKTVGHVDVSLWYVLKGNRSMTLDFDREEFFSVKWFHYMEVPLERCDPHMERFLQKYYEKR